MMELVFILAVLATFVFAHIYQAKNSVLEINIDAAIFGKRRIDYSKILKIERDIGGFSTHREGFPNLNYVITYINENGIIDSFYFMVLHEDKVGTIKNQS